MNEIRDLIIGIDIGKEYTQICYYDRKAEEARSLSMKVGASQYEAPGCICYRTDHGDYCVGLEAEYFAREKGGIMIGNIYDICQKEEKIQVAGEEKEPAELLAHFLRGILKFLGIQDIVKNTRCLCITSPELSTLQVRNYQKACSLAGFSREKYMLMDYGESFYYYALGRKVFYGNNLFAKGACIAGKDRLEDKKLKGYRYLSDSLVTADVGMDMRVMGSPAYYPLIESGSNWYECSASCELILDDTSELVFVVSIPEETEKKRVAMALEGLPKRPNRTSRLSLTLKYVSPRDCEITVEDLGFGEMYPSSGKIWRELVRWDEQEERKQA